MDKPLKLRGVSGIRKRLADGTERIYYRFRKRGQRQVMLGSSADIKAVPRNYKRIERDCSSDQPAQVTPATPAFVRPRLVSAEVAAAYCSLSIPEFEQHVAPNLHKHQFGWTVRYDMREVDRVFDQPGVASEGRHIAKDDRDESPLTRKEAAALCRMHPQTFDKTIRKHPSIVELRLTRPGKKKGLIQFSRANIERVYAEVFGNK